MYCVLTVVGDFLNELSNDGAKMQFENYLKESLFPAMVLCAKVGGGRGSRPKTLNSLGKKCRRKEHL